MNKMSEVTTSEEKNNEKSFKTIVYKNFLLYYVLTAVLLYLYTIQGQYNYSGRNVVMLWSLIIYTFTPLAKVLYEKLRTTHTGKIILKSFLVNIPFSGIAIYELAIISNQGDYYWEYGNVGIFASWYSFIGLIILFYTFRKNIQAGLSYLFTKSKKFVEFTATNIKKYGFKLTLIPFILEWFSIRSLSNNYRAVYFAKKFIILQSKPIKATLPGLLPDTITASMKGIFLNDIDRMQQLFKYNHIRSYSKSATLKFVMNIADPIIKDLQLTLEQHLTEELLKENNNSKDLQINVDNLWKKVEKIMINWESTFSDSELDYKDQLLIK